MALTCSKSMSLVEQKRIQWAREREEMAGLCAPWGPLPSRESRDSYRPTTIRTHFLSTTDLDQASAEPLQKKSHVQQAYSESVGRLRRRSPSLPPIYTRTSQGGQEEEETSRVPEPEDEGETETSGYASESGGNEPRQGDFWPPNQAASWISEQHQQHHLRRPPGYSRGYVTPDSIVSTPPHRWSCVGSDESNRPRWGDRGVGVGHLWEPTFHEPDCRLPQVHGSDRGTPSWLERGLSKLGDSQVLVINHGPEPASNLSFSLAGSCDTINTLNSQIHSDGGRTFLRGQNVPLEPDVLLERERKRQKAIEHQNAIRQQLEERDRKRKEERERRAKEEREEEERIKREQELEQQRLEEELRKQKEREEKEARKAKAMREALENAQKLAKQEKLKARAKHITEHKEKQSFENNHSTNNNEDDASVNWCQNQSLPAEPKGNQTRSCGNLEPSQAEAVVSSSSDQDKTVNTHALKNTKSKDMLYADTVAVPAEGLAVVLGAAQAVDPSRDMLPAPGSSVQLALLMPPATAIAAQPVMVENRILTPTRYRHHARGTQTDSELVGRGRLGRSKVKQDSTNHAKERKKSASLDRPHRGCKLPLRCRSQSQPNQPRLSIEDRPKWGVNRPPMQYVKQSERDPYYQRRLRQRLLRAAMLAGANGGSRSGRFGCDIGGSGSGTGCGGGETGTESDSYSRRRPQRPRQGSSEENSRSPSPQQNSYSTSHKNLFYRQQSQKFTERATTDKADVSVISLDLSILDSFENQNSPENKKRDSFSKGTPSRRVQVPASHNASLRYMDIGSRRKSNELASISSITMSKNHTNKGYSQRLLHRKTQPQVMIDVKPNGNEERWTSQDILSQLTSLRQGLLIKQQEWETRKSQPTYSDSIWQS